MTAAGSIGNFGAILTHFKSDLRLRWRGTTYSGDRGEEQAKRLANRLAKRLAKRLASRAQELPRRSE